MKEFEFNRVYVIESLRPEERLTGEELYKDILRWREYNHDGKLKTSYYPVANKQEFIEKLGDIKEECRKNDITPILHFEIHGNEDASGLVLQSGKPKTLGEPVSWEELTEHLSEINYLTGNNLFLTLAVCYGGNLMRTIKTDRPAPFYGFIGSMDKVDTYDLQIRYTEFYLEFLDSLKINAALDILRKSNPSSNNTYDYIHTGNAFTKAYVSYIKSQLAENKLEDRAEKVFAEEGFKIGWDKKKFKDAFIAQVHATKEQHYQKHSSIFFMLDQFPENRTRFAIPSTLQEFTEKHQDIINK